MSWSIEDRPVLLTGATSGLGLAAARVLAKSGAELILLVRDLERGLALQRELDGLARHAPRVIRCDLASLESIREAATRLRSELTHLPVVIHNAGVLEPAKSLTVDGFERTFAVNHLAQFALTGLLWDLIEKSAPARIVVVASRAHKRVRMDLDALQGHTQFSPWRAYCRTKLANMLFVYELARRCRGKPISVNAMNPGVVATRIGRQARGAVGMVYRFGAPLMRRAEHSAGFIAELVTDPRLDGVSGAYFDRGVRAASSADSHDLDMAKRLWSLSEELTGVRFLNL